MGILLEPHMGSGVRFFKACWHLTASGTVGLCKTCEIIEVTLKSWDGQVLFVLVKHARHILGRPLVMHAVQSNDPVSLIYLDPQSALALDLLNDVEPARVCEISESRLRTLAREQLGVPLSTWLIWRKLERAARDLAEGESLGHAALAGGFSDQAHFTRSMRRMFGVTPKEAARSLTGKGDKK